MNTSVLTLVVASCLVGLALAQSYTLKSISLKDGTSSRGRINAEVVEITDTGDENTINVPVCGSVDLPTAYLLCTKLGYIFSTEYGTVSQFGLPSTSAATAIGNLRCDGVLDLSQCTFYYAPASNCTASEQAALACMLTSGQIAGISIGIILLCLLIICIPVIICCCCCCGICACATGASGGYNKM